MKLRMAGNSLRLRLSTADLQQLAVTGQVTEKLTFGILESDTLQYILCLSAVPEVTASLAGTTIKVQLPESLAQEWLTTGLISLSGAVPNAMGQPLKILVEKDQDCNHQSRN